jgi:hypothetical protein
MDPRQVLWTIDNDYRAGAPWPPVLPNHSIVVELLPEEEAADGHQEQPDRRAT